MPAAAQLMQRVDEAPAGASKRVWIEGTNIDGKDVLKGVLLPLGAAGPARERLGKVGVTVVPLGTEMQIAQVKFGSRAEKLGTEQGFKIASIDIPADRPAKDWMFLPAMAPLAMIVFLLRLRRPREPAAKPIAAT